MRMTLSKKQGVIMSQFCVDCGEKNIDEAKFCRSCGQNLKEEEHKIFGKEKVSYAEDNISNEYVTSFTETGSFSLFSFSGCISRSTYWAITIASISASFLMVIINISLMVGTFAGLNLTNVNSGGKFVVMVVISLLWINLATTVKRLRDAGFSPWLVFLNFVPSVGSLILFVMCAFFSSEEYNTDCESKNNISPVMILILYIASFALFALLIMAIAFPEMINKNEPTDMVHSTVTKANVTPSIWIDRDTELMWQDNPDAKIIEKNWQSATDYCNNLSFFGYDNWRLPNKEELKNLYTKKDSLDFISSDSTTYWSSTVDKGSEYGAWAVRFDDGHVDYYAYYFNMGIRCVRAGK